MKDNFFIFHNVVWPQLAGEVGPIYKAIVVCAGLQVHSHAGESGVVERAVAVRDVKENAKSNPYKSAYAIAESCLASAVAVPHQHPAQYLGRIGNRHRQQCRPRHPVDLAFELQNDHVPSQFDMSDINVGQQRHLLFFTARQLQLLSRARCWYVDGTFNVVKPPFTQLWSIHAFVRADQAIKQVPLAFVLMSSRRFADYRSVLTVVTEKIRSAGHQLAVECVVSDFEAAVWKAVDHVLPQADMRGCAFHWGQAVWRHIQALGYQTAYMNDEPFHSYCRQLLALPCLPSDEIDGMLTELEAEGTTDAQRQLCSYVRKTWVESTVWPPASWSVYQRRIRSNNDVEGWHRRLNTKAARGQLNMYLLLDLLASESRLVDIGLRILKESTVIRRERRSSRATTARLFKIWDRLVSRERTVRQTLRSAAHVMPTF